MRDREPVNSPQATTKGCIDCASNAQSFIPSPETTSLETICENICARELICADDCKTPVLCHTNFYHFCKKPNFSARQPNRH
jgi:hypothetical protein